MSTYVAWYEFGHGIHIEGAFPTRELAEQALARVTDKWPEDEGIAVQELTKKELTDD